MYFLLLFVVVIATVSSSSLHSNDEKFLQFQFNEFKNSFNKRYDTVEEETKRFRIFVENLKIIDERNLEERNNNGTALHGITKFTDISTEEFKQRYLGVDITKPMKNENAIRVELNKVPADGAGLVDWSGVLTTPVKDQGYCGSCWAFSATEQIESDNMRVYGSSFILSPQQITSCDPQSGGCNGGWPYWALEYIMSVKGQEEEISYPYTSGTDYVTGTCNYDATKVVATIDSYYIISDKDIESNMAAYVQSTGPLSICVDASKWSSYRGGVMTRCGKNIDHAVQAVGVNTDDGYWKIRNSWGTGWGEDGYIRVAYGSNTCGLTFSSIYTTPSKI